MTANELLLRYAILFVLAFCVCWLLQVVIYWWSRRTGFLDWDDWRRGHSDIISRWGGLALWPTLVIATTVSGILWPVFWRYEYWGLILAAFWLTLMGAFDDMFRLHPLVKLGVQVAAAGVLVAEGYRLHAVPVPFVDYAVELGGLDIPLTMLAVVLLLNAVNLLEGLNGAPTVYASILFVLLVFVRVTEGNATACAVIVIGLGACLGFLGYNIGRIKTFLGDTGSMVLALIIGSELLRANAESPRLTVLALPVVLLGIPIAQLVRFQRSRVLVESVSQDQGAAVAATPRATTFMAHPELVLLHAWRPSAYRAYASTPLPTAVRTRIIHTFAIAGVLGALLFAVFPAFLAVDALGRTSGNFDQTVPLLLDRNDFARALEVAELAAERAPSDSEARYWYARALMAADRPAESLEHYEALFNMDSNDPVMDTGAKKRSRRNYFDARARIDVGNYFARNGAPAEAVKHYALAEAFGQRGLAHARNADCAALAANGAYDSALDCGWRPGRSGGLSVQALQEVIQSLAHRSDWQLVLEMAQQLKEEPGQAGEGAFWEGRARFETGDHAGALAAFGAAAALGHPDAPFFSVAADARMARRVQVSTLLQTAQTSLYRPFALARALELATDPAMPVGANVSELQELTRAAFARGPGITVRDSYEGPGPRLLGLTVEEAGLITNEPFLANFHWQDAAPAADSIARLVVTSLDHLIASFEGRMLELRRVENLVPWGTFEHVPGNSGLPPGWPARYATMATADSRGAYGVTDRDGAQWLDITSNSRDRTVLASTYWVPAEPKRAYVLAVRASSRGAKVVAGWEWYDAQERPIRMANVINQATLAAPRWQAMRESAPDGAAFVQATVGIFQDAGTASFDAVMILPASPPTVTWAQ